MRRAGLAAVLIALSPRCGLAQDDYTNAVNAAWCVGALGAYALPSGSGTTYLDNARSQHFVFAQGFFGTSEDKGAAMLILENVGRMGAAECNWACAGQQEFGSRAACFNASPGCKRIVACLTE
jgi:hypothetical protein